MIASYLKTAVRSFMRNLKFSLINLFGLSIAFALFILLNLYIKSELNTDKHISNLENIYCLFEKNRSHIYGSGLFAEYVHENYPEIKKSCRSIIHSAELFTKDDDFAFFERVAMVDSNYFNIFKNEAILGSLEHALDGKNGMVLTETAAKRLFKSENPIGQTLSLAHFYDYVVKAVIKDLPGNSLYPMDAFVTIKSYLDMAPGVLENANDWGITTFVEVEENINLTDLEQKLSKDMFDEFGRDSDWGLVAYKDIYFDQKVQTPNEFNRGNILFVRLFIGISIFIILIACINYINLTTVKAGKRAREVGIRKVIGAHRQMLLKQFLIESTVLIFISLIFGFLLAELGIAEFNRLAETDLKVKSFYSFPFIWFFIAGAIGLGTLSGFYPAFVLSSFKIVEVIKGKGINPSGAKFARKALLVFQFVISLVLIIGTIVIFLQINYVKQINLGFDKENVLRLYAKDNVFVNAQDLKNDLLTIPGVKQVAFASGVPGNIEHGMFAKVDGKDINMGHLKCDPEFFKVMGLSLVSGRHFSNEDLSDRFGKYMMNEAAVKTYGWDDPYSIKLWGCNLIGIVSDFNYKSLHEPVSPLFITFFDTMNQVIVKISGSNQSAILNEIENAWNKKYPAEPFNFQFIDQLVDSQYKSDERFGLILSYFSIFGIIIAFMGLLGMASFQIQQKNHEIGIRKVHGGSVKQIVGKLALDFVKWILLAIVISIPSSFFIMQTWLAKNFTFYVNLHWWIFALAGISVLVFSLVIIGIQSYRAAQMNPVESLRYE